jgi:ABC-type Fe3+-hydroxamate transport system substrate-binding protein
MRDKRAKFVQLANQRVTRAIDQIRLIGNLSNRAAYDFTEEDSKKIVKALQRAVDTAKSRFADSGGATDQTFNLD